MPADTPASVAARTEARMPLREHLLELRRRLFLIAVGLAVGAVAGWLLFAPLLVALQEPLRLAEAAHHHAVALNFTGLASALDMRIKVAVFLAALVSCPWWLYQVWAFVTPGLTSKERRYAVGFLGSAVPLFLAGALLAWWMLPHAVDMLTGFLPAGATNYSDAQGYLTFVMRLVLAFGLAFVSPVVLVGLNVANLLRHETLAKGWRWAVLVVFVFAAVMTPTPDALTMLVVALPGSALYFGALGIATIHDRRVDQRRAITP